MRRHIDFLPPIAFSFISPNIENVEFLFHGETQNTIGKKDVCKISGKGTLIFDFGKEYFGGIRLSFGPNSPMKGPNIRIRFGESLGEASSEIGEKGSSNDHSTRDLALYFSPHSDMTIGSTAFRFVRVDFLEEGDYYLQGAFLAFDYEAIPALSFVSSDRVLDQIIEAAVRTLQLNVHHGVIWDGAKRDQHVWAGDLFPSCYAFLYAFDDYGPVKNSIDYILSHYPLPTWYNGIPTYNIWFALTVKKYLHFTQDKDPAYRNIIEDTISLIASTIQGGEWNDFAKIYPDSDWGYSFFDWISFPCEEKKYGIQALARYFLLQCQDDDSLSPKARKLAKEAIGAIHVDFPEATPIKTVNALMLLAKVGNAEKLVHSIMEDGCQRWSSFLSYFLMLALWENGKKEEAYQLGKEYYEGEIKMGGTTLFEEHDPSWTLSCTRIDEMPQQNLPDYHGDHGTDCYTGYRRSLAHAWATGILPFVIENVLGIRVQEDGSVAFHPALASAPSEYHLSFPHRGKTIVIEKEHGKDPIQK